MRESADQEAGGTLRVVVDDREGASGLPDAVASLWTPTYVGRLPVGDVEIGSRVLVERKTVADLSASLADGRLFRQVHALSRASAHPLLVVEGEDGFDALGLAPSALRGVLLSLLVGYRLPLLRTGSLAETAVSIARIAQQEVRRTGRLRRGNPGEPTRARAVLDALGTIPGVGDERARRLIEGLGSIRGVAAATAGEIEKIPGIGPLTARRIRRVLDAGESGGT